MKSLFLLASLLATVRAQSIGVPKVGTTLIPGQNFVVQLINGIDTVRLNFSLLQKVFLKILWIPRAMRQGSWKSAW